MYNLTAISEYWLYPCCFEETSCITAMEMLMSEVICLYYPIAGLTETMGDYGIQVTHGNEIETLLNLKDKTGIKARGKKYAESCSWKNRAAEWENLFTRRVFYAKESFAKVMVEGYINSLSNKWTFFVIDTKKAKKKFLNGENCHVTIKPSTWWQTKLNEFCHRHTVHFQI